MTLTILVPLAFEAAERISGWYHDKRKGHRQLLPTVPLGFVFCFPVRYRLPLHVGRRIRTATLQRVHVVYDVAGTTSTSLSCGRARRLSFKSSFCCFAALDSSVFVALYGRVQGVAIG
jgi:hypothetical protein